MTQSKFILKGALVAMAIVGTIATPGAALAATYEGEVGGWIPWWSDTTGIKSATKNIKKLDTVYPFVYEVDAAGSIIDKANLDERQWQTFFKTARKNKVEIIPTIAWFDGDQIHPILSDDKLRNDQIESIVKVVEKGILTVLISTMRTRIAKQRTTSRASSKTSKRSSKVSSLLVR
jgi:hypothetical protein